MTKATAKLEHLDANLDDLLLDPNNPRFVKSLELGAVVEDKDVESYQKECLSLLREDREDADSDDESDDAAGAGVELLMESMEQIGFVPIDRVVVRRLEGSEKFLVIEGNRRVSAAKLLRERDSKTKDPKKKLAPEIAQSLETIAALRLDTKGLTREQVDEQIGVILGLRHYGAVLGWGPLPKAVNIYKQYLAIAPQQKSFKYEASRVTDVAARLSISRSDVTESLKTYICFKQLEPNFKPEPHDYSLIAALVTNKKLATLYFNQDGETFQLKSESLEKINKVCQFSTRNKPDGPGKPETILKDPKAVKAFSRLVQATADSRGSGPFAKSLLEDVESGQQPLEKAIDNLTSFEAGREWVEALKKLLVKVKELKVQDFESKGNDLLRLKEARAPFDSIRRILDV